MEYIPIMCLRATILVALSLPTLFIGLRSVNADSRETLPQMIAGPVAATVIRIIDGDTVVVMAHPWPDLSLHVAVRLRGIDTPELRSPCPSFRRTAQEAKITLANAIRPGDRVELHNVSGGKFYGRVIADLSRDGENLGTMLIKERLAVPYDGGKRIKPACPES